MWPSHRLCDLLGIALPIVQAPMAGAGGTALAIAAAEAGALGSLPCAMLDEAQARKDVQIFRQQSGRPLNLNFFCHKPASADPDSQRAWKDSLQGYYRGLGLDPDQEVSAVNRAPFDAAFCALVEETRPDAVSFHFGLPEAALLARVKAAGSKILASATTVAEARWLEAQGIDAIIAQGNEAGGHRGIFLTDRPDSQPGTFALVPQVVDAVALPVIAAGGIADGRGIAAAFALGADGVQIGTAFLRSKESLISPLHRKALEGAGDDSTAVTNLFSGRPARGVMNRLMREQGPLSETAPAFPTAGGALAPLKKAAEAQGSSDFSSLWAGQAVALARDGEAAAVVERLAADAQACLAALSKASD
ncbi:MAG: nitronate monooxygenase family protein [Rhodospirillales bacterium]